MQQAIQLKTTIPPGRNSSNRSPWRGGLFLIALTLALFGLSPAARAVVPAPDGGYPDFNTAEGDDALFSLTTGGGNAAIGTEALFSNTTGTFNTATGVGALLNNTTASNNTATGAGALFSNTTIGVNSGHDNTATGFVALFSNTTGDNNTASGSQALGSNSTGPANTANGYRALFSNIGSGFNTATGFNALLNNTGAFNTAIGAHALEANTIGGHNIALGFSAGSSITTGSNNIDIGNDGSAVDSATIRIGGGPMTTFIAGISGVNEGGTISAVYINTNGQLGTQPPPSSRRFKKEIKPMNQTSEAILGLKPVTFRYKSDNKGTPEFGLIAEEVAQVNPDLVVRGENGEIYTVRYEAVNAMLLNEFLKEHQKVQKLEAALKTVNERLKEQDAKIDKVNAKVEMSRPAPQTVVDNH